MPSRIIAYCVKCRTDREMVDQEKVLIPAKGGKSRPALKGVCAVCGTLMHKIIVR